MIEEILLLKPFKVDQSREKSCALYLVNSILHFEGTDNINLEYIPESSINYMVLAAKYECTDSQKHRRDILREMMKIVNIPTYLDEYLRVYLDFTILEEVPETDHTKILSSIRAKTNIEHVIDLWNKLYRTLFSEFLFGLGYDEKQVNARLVSGMIRFLVTFTFHYGPEQMLKTVRSRIY